MDGLNDLRSKYLEQIGDARDEDALEATRLGALGKKGEVSLRMRELGKMTPEERKTAGPALNALKDELNSAIAAAKAALSDAALAERLRAEPGLAAELARLRAAAAYVEAGKKAEAEKLYDEIAADGSTDPILADFAKFRALTLRSADMDPAALVEALTPIADGGGPFHLLALEARGIAHHRAGDADAAAEDLRAAAADPLAPQGLRQRVQALMTAYGLDMNAEAEG